MSKTDYSNQLARLETCSGLTTAQLAAMSARVSLLTYRPGETVLRKGEDGGRLLFTLNGLWEIRLPEEMNSYTTLNWVGMNRTLGEFAFLNGGGATAGISSLTGGSLLAMEHAVAREFIAAAPLFGANLRRLMSRRMEAAGMRDARRRKSSLTGYMAFWLVSIADMCRDLWIDGQPAIPYNIGYRSYGALIGIDETETSKIFKRLREHGLIERNSSKHMLILNRHNLERYDSKYTSS